MKTPRLILALLALTVALAPQSPKSAFAQPEQQEIQCQTDFAKTGRGSGAWTSCEDSMDFGLSRCGPNNV